MNILDLQKRLHNNSIHVDTMGHHMNGLLFNLDRKIKDIKLNLQSDEDYNIIQLSKKALFTQLCHKKAITVGIFYYLEEFCFDCGRSCVPVLIDDEHIVFVESRWYWHREYEKKTGKEFSYDSEIPEEYIRECYFKPISDKKCYLPKLIYPLDNWFSPTTSIQRISTQISKTNTKPNTLSNLKPGVMP